MTQYNLLKDFYIEALTTSGTGTLSLTQNELMCLYDNTTATTAINITASDSVYLEISMYKRIRLDEVRVYMDVPGDRDVALANINFYYKNNESDTYQLVGKNVDVTKFFTLPIDGLFAPKKLLITVSGIEASIYEIAALNYDYNISFGEVGDMVEKQLDVDESYTTIPVYNNSAGVSPRTAYVAVDPTNGDLCEYIKLADAADGNYIGVKDAGVGISTGTDFTYNFRMGVHDNTSPSADGSSVSLVIESEIDSDYYKQVDLPINQVDYGGWGGSQNSWDFTDDGAVYTLGFTSLGSLYLLGLNDDTKEWHNYGLINTPGYVVDATTSMVILGNYFYILLNTAGVFGRINRNDSSLFFETLTTCPNGTLPSKVGHALCSDREEYVYSVAVSSDHTVDGVFNRYSTISGTWDVLDSNFANNNTYNYPICHRLGLSYDTVRNLVYLECGVYSDNSECTGIQSYSVELSFWSVEWFHHDKYYNQAFSYYADYLVRCGYGHGYTVAVNNIRTGANYSLTLPYTQDVTAYGGSSIASKYTSRVLCYPRNDGRLGVMVAGGPYQKVYYFSLGRDITETMYGTYTTPILSIGDEAEASFFYVERECPEGTSVTYSGIENYDSMLIRGFDTPPAPLGKIYSAFRTAASSFIIEEHDLFDKSKSITTYLDETVAPLNLHTTSNVIRIVLFDSYNYDLVFYIQDAYYNPDAGRICRWSLKTKSFTDYSSVSTNFLISTYEGRARFLTLDALGNTWLYNGTALFVFNTSMSSTEIDVNTTAADFIYELSGSKTSAACWYTNKSSKKLECVDNDGTVVFSLTMKNPQCLCALMDGGCAVVEKNDEVIQRYSSTGELLSSCSLSSAYEIQSLKEDISVSDSIIYWVLFSSGLVMRIREDGTIMGEITLTSPLTLIPFQEGVIVPAPDIKVTYQISNNCELVYTWDYTGYYSYNSIVGVFYAPYYTLAKDGKNDFIESISDPVWEKNIDNWNEVKMDNSYFGGKAYYQIQFKLTALPGADLPSVNKLYFSKAVKLQDIYPGTYKNVYVKTELPETCEEKEYTGDLRCWWTKEE